MIRRRFLGWLTGAVAAVALPPVRWAIRRGARPRDVLAVVVPEGCDGLLLQGWRLYGRETQFYALSYNVLVRPGETLTLTVS